MEAVPDWQVICGDARYVRPDEPVQLVWTDPPYGTGQKRSRTAGSWHDPAPGEAVDLIVDVLCGWVERLTPDGVICVCLDDRVVHQVAVRFPERSGWVFRGEVIWTSGLGRPRTTWWPRRHNTIITFTRTGKSGKWNPDAVPRETRKAPKPGYPETKPAGSVWDYTLSNTDPERVGYPEQKPVGIVHPFIAVHTDPGDLVGDPFCGSGTTGVAARSGNRRFFGVDLNPEAVRISHERLGSFSSPTVFAPRPRSVASSQGSPNLFNG